MDWVRTCVEAVVAWLIACVLLFATAQFLLAYVCLFAALAFAILATVFYLRERETANRRPHQELNDLIRKEYRRAKRERR
jgi:hypothetical protein